MEHLAQKEDIQMRPNSTHLLALSEDRNDEVEVLDQGMTSYQSTEDMCETISLLHYSTLTGMIEDDMWIIDSGASRNMTGDQARLSNLNENKTSYKVELGDKTTYPVEGFGQAAIKMKTSNYVHLSNVLYVPGLEKNLVSISCLEDMGNIIAFMDGKVLSWHKNSSIENARVIRSSEGNLYRLLEQNEEALVHDEVNLMKFGTKGTLILIIKHYPFSKEWLKEYQSCNLHTEESVKDVPLGRISRNHSKEAITDLRIF
jgi:hypothetical protein